MNDRHVEKSFLYLLLFSLALHVGLFVLIYCMPAPKPPPPKEPVFIDLQQMPELKPQPTPRQDEVQRFSDQRVRVPRETAPRGDAGRDSGRPASPPVAPPATATGPRQTPGQPKPGREPAPVTPGSSVSSLLKPRTQTGQQQAKAQPQLYPAASRLAKLEENYRRKYENEIAEGETRFLNSDDIQFGSFLRRFETAVYGVWRYPAEAAQRGIEGITPVKITFNRKGEVTHVQLLESSGAKILDDEVIRTLRAVGPVGAFPRGYDKEEFHLIAFFQYGGSRRSIR